MTAVSTAVEAARAVIGVRALVLTGPGGAARRVLGVRQIVQAVLLGRTDTPDAHTLSAAVDVAHAATMLPVLAFGRRARRFALGQLAAALVLAAAEIALVGTGSGRRR